MCVMEMAAQRKYPGNFQVLLELHTLNEFASFMNKRVKLHAKRGFDLSKPGRLAERRK